MKTFKKIKAYGAFEYVLLGALIIIILIGMMNKVKANFGSFDGTKKGLVAVENFFKTTSYVQEDPVMPEYDIQIAFYDLKDDINLKELMDSGNVSRAEIRTNPGINPNLEIFSKYLERANYDSSEINDLHNSFRLYSEDEINFLYILDVRYSPKDPLSMMMPLSLYLDAFADVSLDGNSLDINGSNVCELIKDDEDGGYEECLEKAQFFFGTFNDNSGIGNYNVEIEAIMLKEKVLFTSFEDKKYLASFKKIVEDLLIVKANSGSTVIEDEYYLFDVVFHITDPVSKLRSKTYTTSIRSTINSENSIEARIGNSTELPPLEIGEDVVDQDIVNYIKDNNIDFIDLFKEQKILNYTISEIETMSVCNEIHFVIETGSYTGSLDVYIPWVKN